MSGIIDSHAHFLPGRLARKVRAFFEQTIVSEDLAYPLEYLSVLDSLHRAGVETVWSLPYSHKAGIAAGLNQASAETVQQYADNPVKMIGGATAHPADDDSAAIIETALDVYHLPVLKLHCSVGNFAPDDVRLNPVWETVAARRMPVVIHCGMAVTGRTTAKDLAPLENVARNFPAARIIIAHCGYPATETALALVEKYPNIHADLVPVVFDTVELPVERLLPVSHKLLFGTDAPNTAVYVDQVIAAIRKWHLPADAETAIFGGNAQRLISEVRVKII